MIRALELLGQHYRANMGAWPASPPSTPPGTSRSPYWAPLRTGITTRSKSVRSVSTTENVTDDRFAACPPTPESPLVVEIPTKKRKRSRAANAALRRSARVIDLQASRKKASRSEAYKEGHGPDVPHTPDETVVATSETGTVESIDKIHLIQERVRHDPWKMLVATCLLNKTSGRAARPIYIELLRRYPNPAALSQASVTDLSELLYPLGLFNQRALSLIRFSTQYLTEQWPTHQGTPSPDPFLHPTSPIHPAQQTMAEMDVTIFHGAGVYASDSFRIYSDLFPGRGAPGNEEAWLGKRRRAMARAKEVVGDRAVGMEEAGEYMSDTVDEESEAEWRKVRPNDKELRRYLIWRWGLEGITYDIHKGPIIRRERDRERLGYLL